VKSAIRIKVDPSALASRNITLDELSTAIRAGTSYSGAGQFDGKNKSLVAAPNGQIADAEGYRNLIVARAKDGAPVYLRDVATVVDSVQDERLSRHFLRARLTPACLGDRARGLAPGRARTRSRCAIDQRASSRRCGSSFPARSTSSRPSIARKHRPFGLRRAGHALHRVRPRRARHLRLSRRARDTLIPVVALPLSILLTFLVMWALNYSINNLTLMALTLAIGFLVDDAIVFLENVVRRAEHGESIYRATLNSAGEISFTILSMTLSLAAVFIPLAFMPGLLGRIFREFAITIIVAIFASGLVLAHPHAADVRAAPARARARTSQDLDGAIHQQLLPADPAFLQSLARLVSRSRLARGPDPDRLRRRRLVLLLALPFTLLPTGDSGVIRGAFFHAGRRLAPATAQMQDKLDPILQANPAVDKYFTVAGSGRAGSSGIFHRAVPEGREGAQADRGRSPGLAQSLSKSPEFSRR
jgi:HAE1 family hydrophobic/amphiphilic exporter-1